MTCIIAHNASSTASSEILKTSRVAHMARIVSQETRRASVLAHGQKDPAITLISGLCNFRLSGVPNNSCDSTGILNIDKSVALVDKLNTLQLQSVLHIVNARLRPAFLNARPAFIQDAFHCQNVKPAFSLWSRQNAKSVFPNQHTSSVFLSQNARSAFLRQNARLALKSKACSNAIFAF